MKTILEKNNKLIKFPTEAVRNDFEQDDFDKMISAAFSYMDDDILASLMDDIADEKGESKCLFEDDIHSNRIQMSLDIEEDSRDDFDEMISAAFLYMDDDILESLMDDIADAPEPQGTLEILKRKHEALYETYKTNISNIVHEIIQRQTPIISFYALSKSYFHDFHNNFLETIDSILCNCTEIPQNMVDQMYYFEASGGIGKTPNCIDTSQNMMNQMCHTIVNYPYFSFFSKPSKLLEMKKSLHDLHRHNFELGQYWKRMISKCDGNTYSVTSCDSGEYINISAINNSFICVPEKCFDAFEIADLIIENKKIDSVIIPASIKDVRLEIVSCNNLLDVSFLDLIYTMTNTFMNLCIDISDCEKLQYIRFPRRNITITRLTISHCISLEKVYFPSDVTKVENIFLDVSSCPNLKIVSDNSDIQKYAEASNIPIESVVS